MPVPIGSTLGIFADNSQLRKSVLPLNKKRVTSWAKGLDMPASGDIVLYTGQMYQLMPLIDSMSLRLGKMENSWITNYFGAGRMLNKIINLSGLMARSDPEKERAFNEPLRNIARLLKIAGVEFGYLYERDLYSGALVYDEGLDDAFASHAKMIYRILKDNNVKQVITVDPHTTNILRSIYPKFIDGFDVQVKSYLEILADRKFKVTKQIDAEVTIHDSCIYARHEGVIDQPRSLLKQAGVRIQEAELSGKLTHCCGGPLESLFPSKAAEIATKRIDQLADCAKQIVTSCPICLANLKRVAPADVLIRDISDYLIEAYCPNPWKQPIDGHNMKLKEV
jgi:Fe-S oxidoreductase